VSYIFKFLVDFSEPSLVRKFHNSYYVPHNLVLIVAGKLSEGTSSLLRVIQEQVEPSLIQHNQNKGSRPAGWKRPFVETASGQRNPLPATTKSVVEFPEKDESNDFITSLWHRFLTFWKAWGKLLSPSLVHLRTTSLRGRLWKPSGYTSHPQLLLRWIKNISKSIHPFGIYIIVFRKIVSLTRPQF